LSSGVAFSRSNTSTPCPSSGQTPDGVACHSEANGVIEKFEALSPSQQQDLLNFLRSL
jgi:hypothetical protein